MPVIWDDEVAGQSVPSQVRKATGLPDPTAGSFPEIGVNAPARQVMPADLTYSGAPETFEGAAGKDLLQAGLGMAVGNPLTAAIGAVKHGIENVKSLRTRGITLEEEEQARRQREGYSPTYSKYLAPAGEALGVNVPGMEQAAKEGSAAGVLGHAAAPAAMAVAPMLPAGLAEAGRIPKIEGGLLDSPLAPGAAEAILDSHMRNGGATVDVRGNNLFGKNLHAVSMFPERTVSLDRPPTLEDIHSFAASNADLLNHPNAAVGTWHDTSTGQHVMDVTGVTPNKESSIRHGQMFNQKAVYDLGRAQENPTGGTGEPLIGMMPEHERLQSLAADTPEKTPFKGYHLSDAKIPEGGVLEGTRRGMIQKHGRAAGEEAARLSAGQGAPNGVYVYTQNARPEPSIVGRANRYGVSGRYAIADLADERWGKVFADAKMQRLQEGMNDTIASQAAANDLEHAVKDAGYDGYKNSQRGGDIVFMFGDVPIEQAAPKAMSAAEGQRGSVALGGGGRKGLGSKSQTSAQVAAPAPVTAEPKPLSPNVTTQESAQVSSVRKGPEQFKTELKSLPAVKEFVAAARAGEIGRKWYQRSNEAFQALADSAPDQFQPGDHEKFANVVAATSPQQTVPLNLSEALDTWQRWNAAGRPTDETGIKAAFKVTVNKKTGHMQSPYLTNGGSKLPNLIKGLMGENLLPPDKKMFFKVGSFANNLRGMFDSVTNDSWMGVFAGKPENRVAKAQVYHAISDHTRAAAKELGWHPAEAQAAIWVFTKTLAELSGWKGTAEKVNPATVLMEKDMFGHTFNPDAMSQYARDFHDIISQDGEIRRKLELLGVNLHELDKRLAAATPKPTPEPGGLSEAARRSLRPAAGRIRKVQLTLGSGEPTAPEAGSGSAGPPEVIRRASGAGRQ